MLLTPMDAAKRLAMLLLAAFALVIVAAVAKADEPPQCNLPGWTVTKADGCDCRNCKCGIACDCADDAFTVTHKAAKATKTAPAPPAKAYTIEKRYTKVGNRLFVQDVLVEVSQPASASYAAPQQTYQSPRMDCSSGTCRYVR